MCCACAIVCCDRFNQEQVTKILPAREQRGISLFSRTCRTGKFKMSQAVRSPSPTFPTTHQNLPIWQSTSLNRLAKLQKLPGFGEFQFWVILLTWTFAPLLIAEQVNSGPLCSISAEMEMPRMRYLCKREQEHAQAIKRLCQSCGALQARPPPIPDALNNV